MEKNKFLHYLTHKHKKNSPTSLLAPRTIKSIIYRTVRIEQLIGQNIDIILDGDKETINELFIKYREKFDRLNHPKIYKSALIHYNEYVYYKERKK
jgi:hypothetical protein